MFEDKRVFYLIFGSALLIGIYFSFFGGDGVRTSNVDGPTLVQANTLGRVTRRLTVGSPTGGYISIKASSENSPGLWFVDAYNRGQVNMGLHGDGGPFFLASDGPVRNFVLARVDGRVPSPIMVFRDKDIVKMVFGLSMTDEKQEPFFTYYEKDSRKQLLGNYCDNPSRACTH